MRPAGGCAGWGGSLLQQTCSERPAYFLALMSKLLLFAESSSLLQPQHNEES